MTVDKVWTPAQLLYRLQHAAGIEDDTLIVVFVIHAILVHHLQTVLEVIVIINEIDLHTGRLDGSHLDNQRMVGIINDQIHTREADHLVQLVAAFVDGTPLGHEGAYFATVLLNSLRQCAAQQRYLVLCHVGSNLLRDEQYLICFTHNQSLRFNLSVFTLLGHKSPRNFVQRYKKNSSNGQEVGGNISLFFLKSLIISICLKMPIKPISRKNARICDFSSVCGK